MDSIIDTSCSVFFDKVKIIPQCTVSHETLEEEEEEEEDEQFVKITFTNLILHTYYIKFLIGVNIHGDIHLEIKESENWNFLMYGI